jgi:radical SAM protein with 4Fe4S-binding SPASM domain
LLTTERLDVIFESGLSLIAISIDGFERETFSRLRSGGELATVLDALDELARRKRSLGRGRLDHPRLQINYTLMKSNFRELIPLIDYSRRWELENFTAVHVYSTGSKDMSRECLTDCPEDTDRVLIEAKAKCLEYGIIPRFPQLFRAPAPAAPIVDLSCSAPWRMMKIRWNGDVYPCDLWRGIDNFGSLQTQSFKDIWMSSRYRELRAGLLANAPTFGDCLDCDRISHDNLEGRRLETSKAHTSVHNFESILSRIINRKSG